MSPLLDLHNENLVHYAGTLFKLASPSLGRAGVKLLMLPQPGAHFVLIAIAWLAVLYTTGGRVSESGKQAIMQRQFRLSGKN